jgi:hypothetical protein
VDNSGYPRSARRMSHPGAADQIAAEPGRSERLAVCSRDCRHHDTGYPIRNHRSSVRESVSVAYVALCPMCGLRTGADGELVGSRCEPRPVGYASYVVSRREAA